MTESTHIPLSALISIAAPVLSALVAAIIWLARSKDEAHTRHAAEIKAIGEAKDRAEYGRLDDLRASGSETRAVLERVIPVLERVAIEMRIRNERAGRRHPEHDSEPPRPSSSELEDSIARVRSAEFQAEIERRKLTALTSGTGPKP